MRIVNIVPLKQYKEPKYPTKEVVMRNSDILKTLPQRWKGNFYVGAAFSTLILFSLTACAKSGSGGTSGNEGEGTTTAIFQHGDGRGSFGCVSVAPPAFLSEEEAFEVIHEEMKSYNIKLEKNGLTLKGVKVPETKYYLYDSTINSTKKRDLELDGYDKEKKIAFEFVSREDYSDWQVDQEIRSSVDDYDFLSTAKLLQIGLEKEDAETKIGVFYDPMSRLSEDEMKEVSESGNWSALEKRAKDVAREDLKKQVKDFIEWLKAQGIV